MIKEEIIKHLHEALNSVDITFPYRYVFVEAIEALSQPSLPSDLDDAAEEYCSDNTTLGATCRACFRDGAEWMAGQAFPRWRHIGKEKPKQGECCACIIVTVDGRIKYSNFEDGPWYWSENIDDELLGETEAFIGHNFYGDKEYHTCSYWMPWDEFMGALERMLKK